MYKITLPINYDGYRYGISFFKGVGQTDNKSLADRLKKKGFGVEAVSTEAAPLATETEAAGGEGDIDYTTMTDEELAGIAAEKGISIDGKTRRQVINLLKKEG